METKPRIKKQHYCGYQFRLKTSREGKAELKQEHIGLSLWRSFPKKESRKGRRIPTSLIK